MAPKRKQGDELAAYRKKRDFTVTSEPPPAGDAGERAEAELPSFVVHKHDATRLHYDLRLEMGGVLVSWAVPKGPSYDPAQKRLAVRTEDHPLAYGAFEGRIPDDQYGGGDSLLWDRGHWSTIPPGQEEEQLERGRLHFLLSGEKLQGEWHLIRTRIKDDKENWLFFKGSDALQDPDRDILRERPESVVSGRRVTRGPVHLRSARGPPTGAARELLASLWPPMRAKDAAPGELLAKDHVFEVKYDGYRALAAIAGGELSLRSRNDLDLAARFPSVAEGLRRLRVKEAVLDGEIVSLDQRNRSSFERLLEGEGLLAFVAFDILWLDGEDLRGLPLEERREYLESVFTGAKLPLLIAERIPAQPQDPLAVAAARGLEGLIAKRLGSPYLGERSGAWRKLKLRQEQEVVVVGYTSSEALRQSVGALLVAVHEPAEGRQAGSGASAPGRRAAGGDSAPARKGKGQSPGRRTKGGAAGGRELVYAGKVGTGFSAADRRLLYRELSKVEVDEPPVAGRPKVKGARWVQPRLVAQVEFHGWTTGGRLRQPSFKGLRIDKRPEEVVREAPIPGGSESLMKPETSREQVQVTHGERVVYPKAGYTKADVFAYMEIVAPYLVHVLRGRPLFFQQWPKGVEEQGFYRQNVDPAPDFVTRIQVDNGKGKVVNHVVIDKVETVLWLANQSAFAFHMWSSSLPALENPDWVIFDLDPGAGAFSDLIFLAKTLRGFLEELGLNSYVKTSGKRGLHVLAPIRRGPTHDEATAFAVQVTQTLAAAFPKIATVERTKSKRGGRLYLDAFQNGKGKAIIAPYSPRDTPQATVSTPLEWEEVEDSLDLGSFTIRTMPERLLERGDLFARLLDEDQPLPRFAT